MKTFKIRSSASAEILAGSIGLTEVQKAKVIELETRKADTKAKPLTDNMVNELAQLIYKKDNPELPATLKSYCETWIKEQLYERRKEFTSKYTEKGIQLELQSFEIIKHHLALTEVEKNDEFFENEFITGTPDINTAQLLADAKCPWDCFSFPLFDNKLKDEYYWQGQCYMDLPGKKECKFIYTLMDTPEKIIQNEAKTYCYRNGFEMDPRFVDEFRARLTYPNIPDEYKIRVFEVKRNDEDIKRIYERVKYCREYIASILPAAKKIVIIQ